MHRSSVRRWTMLLLLGLIGSCGESAPRSVTTASPAVARATTTAPATSRPVASTPRAALPSPAATPSAPARVLAFTRTTGFRHDSIPAALSALRRAGAEAGFSVDASEDPNVFTPSPLSRYAAVVFLLTTGDVLNQTQQGAFEDYMRKGGGWAGVHSASDTEYDWPFYGELVSAYFKRHPAVQRGVVVAVDRSHPSTRDLPARWERVDEWYDFRTQPRAHVLLTVDERTYEGGGMGTRHPIAWCHTVGAGRAWYTAMGHPKDAYAERMFVRHVIEGIRWVAGLVPGNCG